MSRALLIAGFLALIAVSVREKPHAEADLMLPANVYCYILKERLEDGSAVHKHCYEVAERMIAL